MDDGLTGRDEQDGQEGQEGQDGQEGLEKRGSVRLRLEALCGLPNEGSLAVPACVRCESYPPARPALPAPPARCYCGRGWNTGSSFPHGVRHGFPLSYNVRFCSSLGTVSG